MNFGWLLSESDSRCVRGSNRRILGHISIVFVSGIVGANVKLVW